MSRARALLLFLSACAGHSTGPPERTHAHTAAEAPTLQRAPTLERWSYEVRMSAKEDVLSVEATLAGSTELTVDDEAVPFIGDVRIAAADGWRAARRHRHGWSAKECRESCRIRYRFALASAAEKIDDPEVAANRTGVLLSPPSAWLLRPRSADEGRYRFHVETPRGVTFVSGVWPDPEASNAYAGDADDLWHSPYSGFGRFRQKRFDFDGRTVEVALALDDDRPSLNEAFTLSWIENSAKTVAGYFGRFPVPRVLVMLAATSGSRVNGTQIGGGGASILLTVGSEADSDDLARDWVAVHEMVHLGVPSMPRQHLWLTEGLATYVEPLARARRGQLTPTQVWRGMVWGMPHGQPEDGDRGLDRTPTWGRTYWGGALFALLADVEIQKRTGGRHRLDDALRAVVAAGGHNGVWWPIDRFFAVGDEATGTTVLRDLYRQMARAPHPIDLPALWSELGVVGRGPTLRFDDHAPLAHIRRALTAPQGG